MSEIFVPVEMYCGVGKIRTTIFLKDGKIADRNFGYTVGICKGCKRENKELVQIDMEEHNTDRTSVSLVDRARFKGGEGQIVVGECSGIPTDRLLEGF